MSVLLAICNPSCRFFCSSSCTQSLQVIMMYLLVPVLEDLFWMSVLIDSDLHNSVFVIYYNLYSCNKIHHNFFIHSFLSCYFYYNYLFDLYGTPS